MPLKAYKINRELPENKSAGLQLCLFDENVWFSPLARNIRQDTAI
jgi:hypothetical protein